ncbi:nucleoside ABC transporter membrane protein [Nakamurella panacisegetis]|uniref:Nucleoside ABC transporter membrane protein n=1 Tax=Nakamurella panacisegetis TaxID=1090615 RepID=A0A1H0P8B2_9ACTN|nr:ABC transporter permease [Nakamurella panacisegetis]SDP01302.1 nucleoside ABC transporter membrane protein [Nakamurella panacisegetis]
MTMSGRKLALGAAGPIGALLVSAIISSIILLLTQHNPWDAFSAMGGAFGKSRVLIGTLNQAASYYLAAVAVAIGFKMGLLNIGVDGQYRLAAMLAAALAGAGFMDGLPSVLRVTMTIVLAMIVGAFWAGIAVWLKVSRGVSEVISTIMLNAIATGIVAYLLAPGRLAVQSGNNLGTRVITDGGQVPVIHVSGSLTNIYTLTLLAVVVGIGYAFLLNRTIFGFSIKATGMNPAAAVASGISAKKMAVSAMLISGAVAGLVGMPELLNGDAAQYSINFPSGLGFIGIAIALLGRNHPLGIVFAALLWSALDSSANALQGVGIPNQLVTIMQATILLSVVIAYEIVRRYGVALEQREVARALAASQRTAVAA